MGKHATQGQKIAFLVHLEYVHCAEAARKAGLALTTAKDLKKHAGELCIEHLEQGLLLPSYEEQVARKEGSGAKPKVSEEEITRLLEACTLSKKQRKKLWIQIAREEGFFDLYRRTIEKKLRERGLRRCKSTKKLDLTDIQKAERYEIALSRKDWTLDDWRLLIFSDEASVIVSAKRGQQKISRYSDERYHSDCIEQRYNNYSEAMFWACFTYDYKGPCYIYYPETAEQKEHYQEQIDRLNENEVEKECRLAFDKQEKEKEEKWTRQGKKFPTRRATWEVYWKNHKQKRDRRSRGGVDNIRYTYETIELLLIPFYHEIIGKRPSSGPISQRSFIFQQDNALSHTSKWTLRRLAQEGIEVLEHVGNSPDMNAIKGA